MLRTLKVACVVAGCLGLTGAIAGAQEVIHAMTGTIRSIDPAQKSFTLFRDNSTLVTFNDAKARAASDEKIPAGATAARAFDKKNVYVIVFYYGLADNPTAIAVQALGTGPYTATEGTVTGFSEKARMLMVKDGSGSVHRYKINPDTVAESDYGVEAGVKVHAEKGDHIRVLGSGTEDSPSAVFISLM